MAKAAAGSEQGGGPNFWRRTWPLLVLVIASVAVFASGAHRYLTLATIVTYRDWLQAQVQEYGPLAVLGYALVYVTAVTLSIPGAVFLTILGGFLFGWLLGGTLAALCATLGAILVFLIARTSVGDLLARKAGPRLKVLADGFRDDAFSYLLFLRLLPIVPFWITNLAPALLGVSARTFAIATLIGIFPATFAFATAGAGLDSVIAAQKEAYAACLAATRADCSLDFELRAIVTPKLIAAFVALGLASLAPVLVRRWRARRTRALAGKNSGA